MASLGSFHLPGGGRVSLTPSRKRGKRNYTVKTPSGSRVYTSLRAAYSHYKSLGGKIKGLSGGKP